MSDKVYVQVGVKGRSIPAGGEKGQILQKNSEKDFDLIWTTPAGGASSNIPQPGTTVPLPDSSTGGPGDAVSFAPINHYHPFQVSSSVLDVKMDGTASLGSATTYAKTDHVHPHDTATDTVQLSDITIAVADWTEVTADQHYTADVTASITGGTSDSKIDLCAEYATILQMDNDGTLAVYVENSSATFTAHSVGEKPTASLTFQVFRTELA